ncbi:MAG TPA: AMP-binding protein [Acidiphilium sp.]|nr:MAG: AMP-dependent synthetase [Acidiphilium sp. 21-60-14]OYV90289.1 MAG: AMP-dependent synthetase [Acidiphilium sp. 37-60-79]HQT89057.1 AMP-binding protein [Acidiphilium sp.]HQU24339.1 AMP-binding protein [Acidiphilium sp.]
MTSFTEARALLLSLRTDYQAAMSQFRWPDPENFNWALDWFDGVLATDAAHRDHPALWIVDAPSGVEQKISFAVMSARSNQAANFLLSQGITKGDRIILLLGNIAPLWEIMLASMKIGAVVIPATTLLTPDELQDRLDRGEARAVITTPDQLSKFDTLAGDYQKISVGDPIIAGTTHYDIESHSPQFAPATATKSDDDLLLYFTSGTTAKPKLVLHTHRSYPVGSLSTMYWIGLQPGDIHLNISSPGWAKHAWSCFFAPWNAGACVFILNQPRFEPRTLLDHIVRCNVTTLCAPPTVWRHLIQLDLTRWPVRLREIVGAGEPLNPEIIEHVRKCWNITIRDGYGQTETTAQIGNPPGQQVKPGAMGRPLPGYQITLLDSANDAVSEGEVAIDCRNGAPAALMRGYIDAQTGQPRGADQPFYRTGDVAQLDEDGYYIFVGRADDVFKSSDYRISPFELESVLIEHPAIAEAAVVPRPDPVRLAVPVAYITLIDGTTPDRTTAHSIFQHLNTRLAPFKRIRILRFTQDLPKTISGKIRRVQLRQAEAAPTPPTDYAQFAETDFPDLRDHPPR